MTIDRKDSASEFPLADGEPIEAKLPEPGSTRSREPSRDRARILFVLDDGADPEERLENAILHKILKDRLGDAMESSRSTDVAGRRCLFGRYDSMRVALASSTLHHPAHPGTDRNDYWTWPTFLENARRKVTLTDWSGVEAAVAAVHADGLDAFVKATTQKKLAVRVPCGETFAEAIGDLAYSFCDDQHGLLVQTAIAMEAEYRLFVIDGRVVTGAGCVPAHTPMDHRGPAGLRPGERARLEEVIGIESDADPEAATARLEGFDLAMSRLVGGPATADFVTALRVKDYLDFAEAVVPRLIAEGAPRSFVLDVCSTHGGIAMVEVNPFHLGRCGLFACDVGRLVDATLAWLGIDRHGTGKE